MFGSSSHLGESESGMGQIWRGRVSAVAIGVVAIGVAGCGVEVDDGTTAAAPAEPVAAGTGGDDCDPADLTIGYASKSATNQGWILINQGAEDAASDLGVGDFRVVGPPIENDISGQLNVVEDFINAQVDGLAIAPVDSSGIVPAIERANSEGIPVVAVDTAIEGGQVASFVATDNVAAAATQAEAAGEELGGEGTVVLINGSQSQQTGRDRRDGFIDTMTERYPDVEVLEVQTEWDPTAAQQGLEDLLVQGDVDAVAHAWDGGTVASVGVLESAGVLDETYVIGFDGAPNAIALMLDGAVDAIVAQELYGIGYEGIETTVAAACGEEVDQRIDTGSTLLTEDTVQEFIDHNPDVLAEFVEDERPS